MKLVGRVRFYFLLFTIFIIPLIFNPFLSDIFNITKGVTLIICTSILFLLWAIECCLSKQIIVQISWVNKIILLILLACTIGIVGNLGIFTPGGISAFYPSFFGNYGTLGTGFIDVLFLCLFYFVASSSINSEWKIYPAIRVLCISASIVIWISLLRYILPSIQFGNELDLIFKGYILSNPSFPNAFPTQNFSSIGEYYLMPLFLLISIILQIYSVRTNKGASTTSFIIDYTLLSILVIGFTITTWMNAYSLIFYLLGAIATAASLYISTPYESKKSSSKIIDILIPIFAAVIISIVFIFLGNIKEQTSPLAPLDASWTISFSTISSSVKNGIFGIGPENFRNAYNLYKPLSLNGTSLIFVTLDHAGSYFFEVLTDFGFIGITFFLFIIYRVGKYFYSNKDSYSPLSKSLMIVFVCVLISMFIIPLNITMLFLLIVLFVFLSTVGNIDEKNNKNFVIGFKGKNIGRIIVSQKHKVLEKIPEKNSAPTVLLSISLILILISISFCAYLYNSQRHYINSYNIKSTVASNIALDQAIDETSKAIKYFGFTDNYYNRLASLEYQKLANLTNTISQANQANISQQDQDQIQLLLKSINTRLDQAIQTNPLNYENYYLASKIYTEIAKTSKGQYLIDAANNVNTAIALNPQNPSIYLQAADIFAINSDTVNEKYAITQSLNKLPSIDGYTRLASLYNDAKEYDLSLDALNNALKLAAPNTDVYARLQNLISQVSKSKTDSLKQTITPTPVTKNR